MKNLIAIGFVAILCIITLGACRSGDNVSLNITDAEDVAARGEYADAVTMCSALTAGADSSALTATQWCRVGMIYAQAAENDIDNDANMGAAAHCFERAFAINADSASAFIQNLPIERHPTANVALQLLNMKGLDRTNFIDPEDTLDIEDHLPEDDEL